jgi:hypothetical protein
MIGDIYFDQAQIDQHHQNIGKRGVIPLLVGKGLVNFGD